MKTNIANYLLQDLSSRFPIQNEDEINADLIDYVVDDWADNKFTVSNSEYKFRYEKNKARKYLM